MMVGSRSTGSRFPWLLVPAVLVIACSDDAPSDTPTLEVAVSPASINVASGGSGTSTATITRGGGFAGAADLTASAPAGITVAFTPATIPIGSTTSDVSVSVGGTVTAGTHAVTITASSDGVSDATTTLSVVVVAPGGGGFTLAAAPAALTAPAGGAAQTSTITITRNAPFAGAVAFSASGAPAGMTTSFNPASATGASTQLSVTAGASVANGTYPIVVRGTGTGVADATTNVAVTVTGGGGGGSVTYTFCTENAPTWVAIQDGSGAWARVNPTAGTTYTFNFPSGRGGVATVTVDGSETDLTVLYATLAELTSFAGTVNNDGCGDKTVNGSVANVGATEAASVSLGYSSAFVFMTTTFQLTDVANGPQDLVAVRRDINSLRTNRIILRRGLNIADNGTISPALDFNASEAFAPSSANVTVTGLGNDTAFVSANFNGVRGSAFGALSFISEYLNASGALPYDAIPLAQLQANEFQLLQAYAGAAGMDNGDRTAGTFLRTPSAQTLVMGPALPTPAVTKSVTGVVARPRTQLASQAQYNRMLFTEYEQGADRYATVIATAAYFGSLPATWDVSMPDLSGASGWQDTWGLQDGAPIDWMVTAQGGTVAYFDATITEGSTTQSASRSSTSPLTLRRGGRAMNLLEGRVPAALRARTLNPIRPVR